MSEIFFISDTHFSHRGIIIYEPIKRPFSSLEEHDEHLVERWNSVVRDEDTVYHLGDFCLNRSALQFASRLRGKKILIMGNHDTFRTHEYLEVGFSALKGAFQYENLILTHVPVHPNQLEQRFFANVHGHLHSKVVLVDPKDDPEWTEEKTTLRKPDWRYLNVGCEHVNMTPITLEEVYSRIVENQKAAKEPYV